MGSDHERQRGGAHIPAPFFVTWSPVPYNNSREVGVSLVNVIRDEIAYGDRVWMLRDRGLHCTGRVRFDVSLVYRDAVEFHAESLGCVAGATIHRWKERIVRGPETKASEIGLSCACAGERRAVRPITLAAAAHKVTVRWTDTGKTFLHISCQHGIDRACRGPRALSGSCHRSEIVCRPFVPLSNNVNALTSHVGLMALLIDLRAIGRTDGIIASDLSDKMSAIAAEQRDGGDDGSYDLARARLRIDEYFDLASRGFKIPGVVTEDRTIETPIGPVLIREYNPSENGVTLIFAHGGGWVIGGISSHDHIARWLAAQTGARVIQIDYALAPEHPYPAALHQVTAVVRSFLAESAGPLLMTGEAAGVNLAAMTILALTPHERRRLAGFVSVYGAYAAEMSLSSHRHYGDGRFGLSEAQMRCSGTSMPRICLTRSVGGG